MLVPTVATIVVGVNGLIDHIDEASNAERARTLSVLSEASGGLVDHLQAERTFGVMITKVPEDQRKSATFNTAVDRYSKEHAEVDAAKAPYVLQKAA
ncbi:MAG TPA: hypothetical protein VN408_27670, partial [Actinoplanes sp.]|nr:hypothetical protein [Actinoplanes sp.]